MAAVEEAIAETSDVPVDDNKVSGTGLTAKDVSESDDQAEDSKLPGAGRVSVAQDVPGPAQIKAQLVNDAPEMMLYFDFLSPQEAEHLVRLADGRWKRSTTSRAKASELLGSEDKASRGVETEGETRTSSSVFFDFDEDPVVNRVAARVAHCAGFPLSHVEPLALIRYRPGEYFKQHHDGSMRAKTVFVYVNTVEPGSGGETYFPNLGLKIRPKACTAVMWGNRLPDGSADRRVDHEAMPLVGEDCVKYGMNCFVNIKPQRDTSNIQIRVADDEEDDSDPTDDQAGGRAEDEADREVKGGGEGEAEDGGMVLHAAVADEATPCGDDASNAM